MSIARPTRTPRPSRQEVRDRLIEAAAQVLAERGFGGASVEEVTARAGFSRGAFYSNFTDKEELFLEVLERHAAARLAELEELIGPAASVESLIEALGSLAGPRGPAGRSRFEHYMALWLHAAAEPALRARLAAVEQQRERSFASAAERILATLKVALPVGSDELGALLSALDHGSALRTLIDPSAANSRAVGAAIRLVIGSGSSQAGRNRRPSPARGGDSG